MEAVVPVPEEPPELNGEDAVLLVAVELVVRLLPPVLVGVAVRTDTSSSAMAVIVAGKLGVEVGPEGVAVDPDAIAVSVAG